MQISTCSLDVICKFSLFFCMVWTLYENVRKYHQCWCLTLRTQGLTGVIYASTVPHSSCVYFFLGKKKNIGFRRIKKKSYLLHSSFIYGSSRIQSFVEAAKNCLSSVAFHDTLKQPLLCRPRLCGLTYCLLHFL